ncbi:MAG: ribonuclease Z [Synergistaceae bacterium]|nr:ribonuclease Z [Synergistaceae bacterium]
MIDIILLGTSALLPLPDRALTSAALFCEGHSILFDCGEGTQTSARKHGVSLMKTELIALTHYHGDHILGIPGLLQTMSCMGRTHKIYITGPEGLHEAMKPILELTDFISFDVELITLPEEGLKLCELINGWPNGARLNAFKTEHRVPSQGYCFTLSRPGKFFPERAQALNIPVKLWRVLQSGESITLDDKLINPSDVMGEARKGIKIIFTGDSTKCESIINASRDADLLICEATYGEESQAEKAQDYGHMIFSQAAQIARDSNVKKLWLTHFSQVMREPSQFLPNAQKIFPDSICCHDGMRITLKPDD